MRRRRVIAGVVTAVVGIVAVGAADGAAPPAPQTGHADAAVTLPRVTVTDPTGATHTVDLGALGAGAVTDTGLVGSLGLTGATLLGSALPEWQVDSSNGPVGGDHNVPVDAAGVTGALGLVGYDVRSTADAAQARLDALTATLTTAPVDLAVDLGQHGVAAQASSTSSSGAVDLTVSGLRLALGDLLPADLLAALPLSTLLDLASAVGAPLPAGAGDVAAQLSGLVDSLPDLTAAAGDLADAQQALGDLLASLPTTAAAQQQLDDAQQQLDTTLAALADAQQQLAADSATVSTLTAQVASLQAQVDSLTTQLADPLLTPLQVLTLTTQLNSAQSQLTTAQQQLAQATADVTADQALVTTLQQQADADQAAVDAAQQALDDLVAQLAGNPDVAAAQALVDDLTNALTDLVTHLTSALGALPDLDALRTDLLASLPAAPILDVGTIGATLATSADDAAGEGSATCTVTGATVLGQPVPVGPCHGLVQRFDDVRAALTDVLGQLPLPTVPAPSVDGLSTDTTGAAAAADDADTAGSAALTPLHVAVPAVTAGAAADAVVTQLAAALDAGQQQLTALGQPALTAPVAAAIAGLAGVVSTLPSGAAVAGLRTVGLDISLVGLRTSSTYHRPAAADGGGTGDGSGGDGTGGNDNGGNATGGTGDGSSDPTAGPHAGSDPTTPVDAPPRQPTGQAAPVPNLPYTGDNTAAELAAGLLLALGGAHLLAAGRRQRTA